MVRDALFLPIIAVECTEREREREKERERKRGLGLWPGHSKWSCFKEE